MLEVRLLYRELAQYSRAQQELALHDALTGLPNRRLLEDRIATTLQHANRNHHKAAIMYIDLDGFKAINDTYGHAYGDEVLKTIAKRLLDCSRKEDTVARLGGDEFMVVLSEVTGLADAQGPAAKIVEAVSEPIFINDLTLGLSTSIGISIYPDDAETVDSLISIADYALYEAKRGGKNRFCATSSQPVSQANGKAAVKEPARN
jgi:diguanylate cyclase (GGDEF)-like protein